MENTFIEWVKQNLFVYLHASQINYIDYIENLMSFFQIASRQINPKIIVQLNDILFIMIVCFYIGRFYEQRKNNKSYFGMSVSQRQNILMAVRPQNELGSTKQQEYLDNGWNEDLLQSLAKQQLHGNLIQTAEPVYPQPKRRQESRRNSVQIFESQRFPSNRNLKQTKQSQKENILQAQPEWLKQKVKLDGQKVQQKGKFQLLFQKSKGNLNLVRKIQKHEIITDYILKNQANCNQQLQVVPLKKQHSCFPNENSIMQVQYYQNYNKNSLPVIEKRIIQLNERPQVSVNTFIEHGKFRKMYRNIIKIGEGGFGTVYQAYNMLQSKKYAIKKIFINKNTKQIENIIGQIKILNNLSHPNIVKYNSCWLQYAQFNEHKEYQRILEGLQKRQQRNGISIKFIEDMNENQEQNDQQFEQSYVSSGNSGFSFARSSKSATKKSISNKNSVVLVKKDEQKSGNVLENSFGLLPVMYIQMELCEHSLAYYIKKRQSVDRVFAYQIMDQLINGVNYIHANKIIHRDLKPQNILFSTTNGSIVLKIGDFGLAVQMQDKQKTQNYMIPNTRAGTPSYIAPELYFSSVKKLNEQDLQKTDVYSLAVIYYEILNKFSTSHERGQKLNLLKQGKVAGINQFKQQKKLIHELIKQNRPKGKQILTSQAWKKLTNAISKVKRQMLNKNGIIKKDSNSTNNTSNFDDASLSLSLSLDLVEDSHSRQKGKQKSKSKSRNRNKNRHDSKRTHYECENAQTCEENYQNAEQIEQVDNSCQLEQQLYQHNLLIIKRSTSTTSKGAALATRKISDILEEPQEISINEDMTHPQLEKQEDWSGEEQ